MNLKRVIFGIMAVAMSLKAQPLLAAKNTNTVIAKKPAVIEEEKSKPLGLELYLVTDSSFHNSDDVNYKTATALWISPSYKISEHFNLASLLVLTRDEQKLEEPNTVSNLKVSLSYQKIEINKIFAFVPGVALRAPTNREAREDDTLMGGFTLEPKIVFDTEPNGGRLSGSYRFALGRNVHEFNVDRNGSPNIEYSMSNRLTLNYKLSDKFTATAIGDAINSRTYRNFERSKFEFAEQITYEFSKQFNMDLGHSNTGDSLRPNQHDSNLALFDEQQSTVSIGATYVF